ncbi:hypothetical protein lerEdw1_019231 [Lerista edwardsae]|nr:hypothetical protein lerEdw1_019231 [Lerista edwardsae]
MSMHSDCFIKKEQEACLASIQKLNDLIQLNESSSGVLQGPSLNQIFPFQVCQFNSLKSVCLGMWDNLTCWKPAFVGEVVIVRCPELFTMVNFEDGWDENSMAYAQPGDPVLLDNSEEMLGGSAKVVSRNCTEDGWSEPFPHYYDACGFDENETIPDYSQDYYYLSVKALYTVGYSTSLVSLTTAMVILCRFSCWDMNDNTALWWVIKGPVVASIMINFLLFIGIIIILVQKLQSPDIGGNESSIYLLANNLLNRSRLENVTMI